MDYVFMSLVVSTASGIVLASLAAGRASKCYLRILLKILETTILKKQR